MVEIINKKYYTKIIPAVRINYLVDISHTFKSWLKFYMKACSGINFFAPNCKKITCYLSISFEIFVVFMYYHINILN